MDKKYYVGEENKTKALELLYESYKENVICDPKIENAGEFNFVWGCGDVNSKVVLIGEAPGKDEVIQGKPFVGKAGSILDSFLEKTGIERQNLLITNTIKYRLARQKKGSKDVNALANRPAKHFEIKTGAGLLKEELQVISPDFVVTMGNVPLKAVSIALLPNYDIGTVGEEHGKTHIVKLGEKNITIFPIFHPASLIYNPQNKDDYEKDLLLLKVLINK